MMSMQSFPPTSAGENLSHQEMVEIKHCHSSTFSCCAVHPGAQGQQAFPLLSKRCMKGIQSRRATDDEIVRRRVGWRGVLAQLALLLNA